jgi:hypothetical protein
MRYLKWLAISGLLISFPAVGASAADTAAKERPEQRLVCKRKPVTGTRFPTKTCRTALEWDKIAEQNKRDAAEMTNRPIVETRRE